MKTIIGVLFVVSTCSVLGQEPADGFYLKSADDSALFALTQEGKRIALGHAQQLTILRSRIYAEDNANTTFFVMVHIPSEGQVPAMPYALVVANHAYSWPGTGGGPGYTELSFKVSGFDNVRDVSRFLSTPIEYREHPGHQLLVSFTPVLPSFRTGEEVKAKFRIENIGTKTISFMRGGRYRGSTRDNQYMFSAEFLGKQVRDIGSSINFGGIGGFLELKPGDVFQEEISLNKWFAFDKKGVYEVLGSYDMTFCERSDKSYRIIWRDYVSAKFSMKID